ncbi:precorrin-6Y C5,15-methyltransferase (decarboxylating) subunit CbiT [Clostridium sp. 'White wine YQ']|uniref:precorrin-6Y C5,15-methyltransferase (decarboxylating) subunit CbiT n=1 Tax=Clostridium sp. 'White wine YQ' TaxID=3027474 RepID=UPI002366062A|nr:precorrin-6Y C5,15-methyltransferase (decarboxylating) subunit CbiT [Clostridium sp. 'White wine YQ']MDD7795234.1 precorrin-6Y C5,15-methyltransferase (decarboxylating) subunit CbiT [Clostridium sp. 'White wine YQ']
MIYIKDEEFIRGKVPMTKEEVRILSISKLELSTSSKVLDVGAGTGSVSVQMSKICKSVIAIEKEQDAFNLILENKNKFNCDNLEVILGEALHTLNNFPDDSFDGIFIGGSGGNLEEIISASHKKLKKLGKIVLNFITIDNCYKACEVLKALNYNIEITQVNISKNVKGSYMLTSNNGIFIVSGRKEITNE